MKRRGRPTNADQPEVAAADDVIGRTVSRLMFWGFSQTAVCECVGKLAARILKRTDHLQRGLGAERIEQIYEAWLNRQPVPNFARGRWRYPKRELARRRPRHCGKAIPLKQLACRLLASRAEWPCKLDESLPFVDHGDSNLTPKAHADYLRSATFWAKLT